ncbi:hypothetical protein O181_039289 [Austropuccinia psidii MF-1]|uniref:RNase H type-1 domain-containing protein n=1 Tax=Austropuccinia psidii MF-1 TaxID=1389203 RepID=A0A9Q3DA63_9BASI|nr:hypothetical protein [Austropuccinia psidii MF-1]
MYWAHQTNLIHPGHVGGRLGKIINDAFVTLTSWITNKWREGKIVMGLLLDNNQLKDWRLHISDFLNLKWPTARVPAIKPRLFLPSQSHHDQTNSQLTKSQVKEEVTRQVKNKIANQILVFFANGSLILGKSGGATAILTNTQSVKTTYVGGDSILTNFETELTALLLCHNLLSKHINKYGQPKAVETFSDSQAGLKSITLPKKKTPGQQLTTKIFNNFQCWTQHFPVRLYWCPGHTGIKHNEEVDKRAKEAVTGGTTSHHSLHHISISKLKQIKNQDSRAPPKLTIQELARVKLKTPPKLIIQALD